MSTCPVGPLTICRECRHIKWWEDANGAYDPYCGKPKDAGFSFVSGWRLHVWVQCKDKNTGHCRDFEARGNWLTRMLRWLNIKK